MKEPVQIYTMSDEPAVLFAAGELARCLRVMTGGPVNVKANRRYAADRVGIYLGLPTEASPKIIKKLCPRSEWDDALRISTIGSSVLLTGSNPRSVLFAAYRWLEALGARWVRPGKDGEVLPAIEHPLARRWEIHEQAANRHRGIVIEGGCPIEQVLDLVDWMPKLRMNAYMLQFKASGSFWRRWYVRTDLPVIENPHWLSFDECAELDARVIADLQRRGMLFHRVGHGWTCEAVGTLAAGWDKFEQPPESVRRLLAEVNGKREWFDGGIPLNTELCYSQPEVRQRVVDTVLAYAVDHIFGAFLHALACGDTEFFACFVGLLFDFLDAGG